MKNQNKKDARKQPPKYTYGGLKKIGKLDDITKNNASGNPFDESSMSS